MPLCDIGTLASQLQVSKATIYRLTESNRIPFYRIKHQLRFDIVEVQDALRANGNGNGRHAQAVGS